jgi:hypothetical protein
MGAFNCPASFSPLRLLPCARGRSVGHEACNPWRRGVKEGRFQVWGAEIQLNSTLSQYSRKLNNQPAFFALT